ncbi:putative HNHc superfamily protein [Citrobacter phage CVT22]|uniref:HNHc superfamily protein n=1 Tax=Citrobacter phage CVT22 TaxID=1622234 RepID=A0A0R5ZWN9_9CAUD|nr:HNH endonuclease [Citrobacter phage CVT22]AJT60738.1 putative HNHc superfamily protein [Citrobacter phage CVT22]
MCEAYPEWTQSRYESFVKSVLRAGSRKWPPKYKVLNEAKCGKMVNELSGRVAEHYRCADCNSLFPAKLVVVDHCEPVVATSGFTNWDDIIQRMFCSSDGLQVLCKDCHKIKTKQENEERKANKQ